MAPSSLKEKEAPSTPEESTTAKPPLRESERPIETAHLAATERIGIHSVGLKDFVYTRITRGKKLVVVDFRACWRD